MSDALSSPPSAPPAARAADEGWALWRRACDGQARAATLLVQHLAAPACRLAMQVLRDRHDAEDVVQDAFIRLWRSRPSDQRGASLSTYFHTIVLNRCKTLLARRREWAVEGDTLAALADDAARADPSCNGGPADVALGPALQQALAELPPRQRMALAMWAYADASVLEIGRALEIDLNATHQLLHRARQALKRNFLHRNATS